MRSTLKENHKLQDLKADGPCEGEEGSGFPGEVMLQLMVREVRYGHRDKEEGKSFHAERSVSVCVEPGRELDMCEELKASRRGWGYINQEACSRWGWSGTRSLTAILEER